MRIDAPRSTPSSSILKFERVSVPGLTANLRRVQLRCVEEAELVCTADVYGEAGALVTGSGRGICDFGGGASGSHPTCDWTWSRIDPSSRTAEEGDSLRAPVHVVSTKLWAKREEIKGGIVALGSARVRLEASWLPLTTNLRFVSGSSPGIGDVALLIGEEGDAYLAR
jgi:hypothetical protein